MKQPITYDDLFSIVEPLVINQESDELEYKTALGGFPQSFWETYSSFANTNGGTIVFGVKELPTHCVLDGLDLATAEKYQRDFFNMMHNREKVNIPLLQENNVHIAQYQGAYFLVFYIPRANRTLRPVYCGRDPYTGTYRRDSDGDYHCTPEEIRSMFADADTGVSADGRILKNYSIHDLDSTTIQQYRRLFQQSNPDHVWNRLSEEEFLGKINVFRTDRETGQSGLTLAGLLMFGTYSALMDACPNYFPDYQEIESKAGRWVNRICPDGNWESNLFQFYWKVLPILQGFLPKPFALEGNTRINETAAHVAVREAFTNALVHADYSQNISLNVYKYPTKIVFSNPGTLLISLPQYYKGGESVCRNRYLQTMFAFLGSAEKAGSGSDKIMHGWESLKWAKPMLIEQAHPNKVVLTMKLESLLDDSTKEKLAAFFGTNVLELPRHQLLTLASAATDEAVSNEYLQFVLGIHKADIGIMLHTMCKNHLLISEGHGKGTIYRLPTATLDANVTTSGSNVTTSNANVTTSNANVTTSDANVATSRKKRMSLEQRQQMILDYCSDWRTIEEMAAYLHVRKEHVRGRLLPTMEHMLDQKYPRPHHPRQRYRRKMQDPNSNKQ